LPIDLRSKNKDVLTPNRDNYSFIVSEWSKSICGTLYIFTCINYSFKKKIPQGFILCSDILCCEDIQLPIKGWFFGINRLSRRVSLVEQEQLALLEHLNSPIVFSEVRVAQSLDFSVVFCRSLFGHCVHSALIFICM